GLFMPLEFSVAAFRFGHSMVRPTYEWNYVQSSKFSKLAPLRSLFRLTNFSGDLNRKPRLESDWIIDFRRFFDLSEVGYPHDQRPLNKARKIDTHFSLHIEDIPGYPHPTKDPEHQSIAARNLLRGFSFGLLSGEEIAHAINKKIKINILTSEQVGLTSPLL